jgi:Ni,Fe-hydrogenase maturation factor
VLIGVQPAALETGLELSPAIKAQLPAVVEMVLEELRRWGHAAERRQAA